MGTWITMSEKEEVQLQNAMDEYRGRRFEFLSGQGRATYAARNNWTCGQEIRILSKHSSVSEYEQKDGKPSARIYG